MSAGSVTLDGTSLTLEQVVQIAFGEKVTIAPKAKEKVAQARQITETLARGDAAIYGVNTGFGFLARSKIGPEELALLQRNIILSHASGHGEPLSREETRAMLLLRLNVLLRGVSGVRFSVCEMLANLLNAGIHPLVPEKGSVGASGDLAPLAHLSLALIGEGKCEYRSEIIDSAYALKQAGLKPLVLAEKEGLCLVNGTQAMGAVGGLALQAARDLAVIADIAAALTIDARRGGTDSLHPFTHEARNHPGQIRSAARMVVLLKGSKLSGSLEDRSHIQDPYSLRCTPQVHGPSFEALDYAAQVIDRELNAATDNPIIALSEGKFLNGGNFHGQPLALAFDFASIAAAELGNISERRIEQLLNPHHSGLPAFLTPKPGINSGFMAAQYLAASLVNENKIFANPACTDSIPGNVNVEDHVSMGMTSARKFRTIVENLRVILGVEILCAVQAIDLLGVELAAPKLQNVHRAVRKAISKLEGDRIIAEDVEKAVALLKTRELIAAADIAL